MGMNTHDLLLIKLETQEANNNYQILKSEFEKIAGVISVTASSNIPAVSGTGSINLGIGEREIVRYNYISIDTNFPETFGIGMVDGNSLTRNHGSGFLLNKSAVEELGLKNPIGESITLYSGENGNLTPSSTGVVVGVLNDFSYRPNYDSSKGAIFNVNPADFNAMFVQISPADQPKTILELEKTGKDLFDDMPLSIHYLNEEIENDFFIQKLYKIRNLILVTSIFSFLIALSGLLGISILTIRKRVKEIGIRKVNGASSEKVLVLVNGKLLKTVLVSVLISFPVSIGIGHIIKSNQTNGIALSFLDYSIVFITIVTIIAVTVSWQSWRAATRNPVEALRYE
ncbi:ABC transporter permease [Maribellus luteus]|nr:FtsX-like permease family protein [Maribellus luteus]